MPPGAENGNPSACANQAAPERPSDDALAIVPCWTVECGGGGSRSTRKPKFPNTLRESKRQIREIRSRAGGPGTKQVQ